MEYRTLAHTDLTLSAITFGSRAAGGWMWGKSNRDEAVKAIKAAYDGGVTSIDTARFMDKARVSGLLERLSGVFPVIRYRF